jgi:ribosomal protein L37AE/L43A
VVLPEEKDYRDHQCPRCGCRNTVDHYGAKLCDCCGLWFISAELDEAGDNQREVTR